METDRGSSSPVLKCSEGNVESAKPVFDTEDKGRRPTLRSLDIDFMVRDSI